MYVGGVIDIASAFSEKGVFGKFIQMDGDSSGFWLVNTCICELVIFGLGGKVLCVAMVCVVWKLLRELVVDPWVVQ